MNNKDAGLAMLDYDMMPDFAKQAAGDVKKGTNWVQPKREPNLPEKLQPQNRPSKKSRPLARKPKNYTLEEFNYLLQGLNGKPLHVASGPYYYKGKDK